MDIETKFEADLLLCKGLRQVKKVKKFKTTVMTTGKGCSQESYSLIECD